MFGHGVGWREFKEGGNGHGGEEGSAFEVDVFPWVVQSSSGSSCEVWWVAARGK